MPSRCLCKSASYAVGFQCVEWLCGVGCWVQVGERIWNVLSVGEVTLLEILNIEGVELLLSLHQLTNADGVLLEGRVRVWNALVRLQRLFTRRGHTLTCT